MSDILNKEQLEEVEKLSALDYSLEDMALYFDVDVDLFVSAANSSSSINYHMRRGKLITEARMQLTLLNGALAGNTTSLTELNKARRDKRFESSKVDVFGGFENEETFSKIEDYVCNGIRTLSPDEAIYMDVLLFIVSVSRRSGRRNTVKLLTRHPFNCTYAKASDLYDEANNLFYSDRSLTKTAIRNKYAEMLDDMALQVKNTASCSKDLEVAASIIMQAAKLRDLDKEDPVVLNSDVYAKKVRLYSLDAAVVGGAINRTEVAQIIDNLSVPDNVKGRLKRDARTADVDVLFETLLHESQETSISE